MTRCSYFIKLLLSFATLYITFNILSWLNSAQISLAWSIIILVIAGNCLDEDERFHPIVRVIVLRMILSSLYVAVILTLNQAIPLRKNNPPTLSPETQSSISEAFEKLPKGMFVFSCPTEMIVGISEKCEARIANEKYLSAFKQNLQAGMGKDVGEVPINYVSSIMNVKLTSEKFLLWKSFDIKPQEDGGDQPVIDRDSTIWEWDVIPQDSGIKKLKFIVSVILEVPGYSKLPPKRYKEKEIDVFIKINPVSSASTFVKTNWKYLLAIISAVLILIVINRKLKIIGTNIEVGSVGDIDLRNNEGVLNLFSRSKDIINYPKKNIYELIQDLPHSSNKAKISFEKLRQFIQYNPDLSKEKKEQAFEQVKKLIEIYKEYDSANLLSHDCIKSEIAKLRTIIASGSSVEASLHLVNEIAAMLFKIMQDS
jgi:hypothetical protein